MDAIAAAATLKALDGLTARSIATAENVANAGTPHYRPVRVTFESALADAVKHGPEAIRAVKPQLEQLSEVEGGSELRLDLELATASATTMRYAALIEVLNREMQIDGLAVSRNS